MDYLVSVTDLKVFGCSIDFLQTATQTYLEDPIWDKLEQSMEYTIVFRDSFFFHEYGRRVGMVPRSSLKEGKNSLMVEKRTRTTRTTQNKTNHSPQAESPPSCSLSSVLGETSETKTDDWQYCLQG